MKFNRRSIRIPSFNYAQSGAYFITICTKNNSCIFGTVEQNNVCLGTFGKIVRDEWLASPKIRQEIALDSFVVMPNHFHGIIFIDGEFGDHSCASHAMRSHKGPGRRSLGSFVGGFKAITTRRINEMRGTPDAAVWQRNYYERVIRNEKELCRVREYIQFNPLNWEIEKGVHRTPLRSM